MVNKGDNIMQTKAGGRKMVATMSEKYGSYEGFIEQMRKIGATGGKLGRTGGFFANRELASRAGKIGGTISRRKKEN